MTQSNMSSSLGRNSSLRKSFRLEITLEKSFVETSPETENPRSSKEFASTRNWSSDPRLLTGGETPVTVRHKKSESSGSLATSASGKNKKSKSEHTMNESDLANGASSQKTKPGPVTRIKTVIRSTKETIVERLPGGSSKSSTSWISRSRPRSVGASQRFGVQCNGNIRPRDKSFSPPRERKPAAAVDRSRSFNGKSRVNLDGFVSKRCEVWERKSRDSSPERITFLPVDLPFSDSKRKSLVKQRTAQLFEPKSSDNSSLPSKKQLLLDLNGRTPKDKTSKDKPAKPQLKPKRVNLFKRGLPVKPTENHCVSPSESAVQVPKDSTSQDSSPVPGGQRNHEQVKMGNTCSLHQEEGVREDDYGVDVLKAGYDQCNGITPPSPNHSMKSSPERRSVKCEKENQNAVLPSKHRTTSNSSKLSDTVQSNGPVPTGVLTERQDKSGPNIDIPARPLEAPKRQTVVTLNGVKLVEDTFVNNVDVPRQKELSTPHAIVDSKIDDDDVFENCDVIENTAGTINGAKSVQNGEVFHKGGHYFIGVMDDTQDRLNGMSKRAENDLESEIPEEASGRLRAAIGKTNLLTTKKFKQFRGLCEENIFQKKNAEGSKVPTSEDLAGFWDLVMIQVDDVTTMFEEIDTMRKNNWQSPRRVSQVQPPETRTPKKKTRVKPKATTPNSKSSLKDAEKAAKAKQQREEARRRLMAAKKAMRRRTLSGSMSDEGAVEIFL